MPKKKKLPKEVTRAILGKIEQALSEVDFSEVPPDKLLLLRLHYIKALKQEEPPKRPKMTGASIEEILTAYMELLNEVRAGRLTAEQAAKENSILAGMTKTIEATQLKARIEEIEGILSNE